MLCAYRTSFIDFIHPSECFRSLDNGHCLNGDDVTKSLALAVNDTWSKDVGAHTMLLAFLDHHRIGIHALEITDHQIS